MLSYNQTIEKIKGITEEIKALETKTDIYKHREILREYHKNGNTEAIKKAEADFLDVLNVMGKLRANILTESTEKSASIV